MSQGHIVEQGKHDPLVAKKGAYYNLVEAQRIAQETEEKREDEELSPDEKEIDMLAKTPSKEVSNGFEEDPADLELGRTKTGKSESSKVIAGKSDTSAAKYSLWTLMKLVGSFNKKEWHIMLLGLISAFIAGAGNPVQAVFFAKSIVALSLPASMFDELKTRASFWSWMYFMLALVQLISLSAQGVLFAYCSERLVHRSRDKSFRTMLRQDIAFFDKDTNTAGALTSFLSTETTHLAGVSGVTLGTILSVSTTLIVAFTISLAVGWKLALVCIATVPIVLACGFFRFWMACSLPRPCKGRI